MHADELHIDAPLVRRLLTQQFPEWAAADRGDRVPRGVDCAGMTRMALHALRELVADASA